MEAILKGEMGTIDDSRVPNLKKKVMMFVSSTFTDTKAERNTLMKGMHSRKPYVNNSDVRVIKGYTLFNMPCKIRRANLLE